MKKTFDINFVDGHLLISDNGNTILVDTGSPTTVHQGNILSFLGRDFAVYTSIMGSGIEMISKLAGFEFNTLLGMDILSQYRVVFDYAGKQLTFLSEDEEVIEGAAVPLVNLVGGLKAVMMQINGQPLKMALDTGAPLSYISEAVSVGLQKDGEKEDFHPSVGRFLTPVYHIETEIAGKPFMCSYGNLPVGMSMVFHVMDGIVGYDFFKTFKVMLDCKGSQLVIA